MKTITKTMMKSMPVLLVGMFLMSVSGALAGKATLSWNANTENDLQGYKVYYGTSPRTTNCPSQGGYASSVAVGNVTSYVMNNLEDGKKYYFSVSALDTSDNESCYSSEVSKLVLASDSTVPSLGSDANLTNVVSLDKQAVHYQKSRGLVLIGNTMGLTGGTVKVYRGSKLIKKVALTSATTWQTTASTKTNKRFNYRFVYTNAQGKTVSTTPWYKIYVDTMKPQITGPKKSVRVTAGANVRVRAKDKTGIAEYTYNFDNVTTTSTQPIFTVPTNAAKGTHLLIVTVKDKAGNISKAKRVKVTVI